MNSAELVIIGQYASITMQIAMYYCSIRRIPWVFWSESISGVLYGDSPLVKSEKLRRLFRSLAIIPIQKWPCQCWGIGDKAIDSFKLSLPHTRFEKYFYYSDLSPYFDLTQQKINSRCLSFLFSGSLSFRKGFDLLIGAVGKLNKEGIHQFQVHVVGTGPLEDSIPDNLKKYFKLNGFVQRNTLPSFYKDIDVFVFPSRYDGWGMALIEALASGIPVIASPFSGAAVEVIETDLNGWILKDLNIVRLAEKMKWCIANKSYLSTMFQAARQSVKCCHIDAGAERFIELSNRLTNTQNN